MWETRPALLDQWRKQSRHHQIVLSRTVIILILYIRPLNKCVHSASHCTMNLSLIFVAYLWDLASGSLNLSVLVQIENGGCQAKAPPGATASAAQPLSATWHASVDSHPCDPRLCLLYFWYPGDNHILKTVNRKLLNTLYIFNCVSFQGMGKNLTPPIPIPPRT